MSNLDDLLSRLDGVRQFQSIRGYTKDGELACICANHESAIKELLATHTDNGGSNG